jgi:tRNA (guanine37-N1)-methyltransferase
MHIHILTLFPQMFEGPFSIGLFQKAVERGLVTLDIRNIRDYTHDKHHTTDDYPYGGGAGMVMKPEPIFEAVEVLKSELAGAGVNNPPVILMSPQGRLFTQEVALELSKEAHLIFICGEYEGVDERVCEHLVTDEISIGDYVLTGGEPAAMVVVNAVARLIPGFLGSAESLVAESHNAGLLEYPQYTRPPEFRGWNVPDVLLSGNHAEIARWRKEQSLLRTAERRPDLIGKIKLDAADEKILSADRRS